MDYILYIWLRGSRMETGRPSPQSFPVILSLECIGSRSDSAVETAEVDALSGNKVSKYPLVMTKWKITMLLMGKSTINGHFQ